jgi:UDP-N-acetyl-D-galactosamine dehydrogenase
VGFDIDRSRVQELRNGHDRTGEVDEKVLRASSLRLTDEAHSIADCTVFIVTVPTPIDDSRQPDLRPVISASRTVGSVLKKGDLVIYESTVYPGVTEDVCAPILAEVSGLAREDFHLGYSPERINPGDKVHRLETITKVVSGDSPETLERVAKLYESIVPAGVHRAPSIKVAEAAKVIENTQRDLNIALMNELALIFDRMGIRTKDVLAAAGTKWNFLPFTPGLVGGHCIGVDPYYLTAKAELLGYHPEVILAGRRINDGMGRFIAQKLIKMLIARELPVKGAKVGVLGLTFKEDVPDLRNSRVPDILRELSEFGVTALVHDPLADAAEAKHEYGVELAQEGDLRDLDALVVAVGHREYLQRLDAIQAFVRQGGVLIDVKSCVDPSAVRGDLAYWSL